MKTYEVEIYESGKHGSYKSQKMFTWILSHNTIACVKDFAIEILAGMTYEEVFGKNTARYGAERIPNGNGTHRLRTYDAKEKLGFEAAEKRFTIKARVFKG